MEIKLQLSLQTLVGLVRFLERMEEETFALIIMAVLMCPVVVYSLWALGLALLWEMIAIGFKAGVALFWICTSYCLFLRARRKPSSSCDKCTILDMMLSVLFQTGIRIPACIWSYLDQYLDSDVLANKTAAVMGLFRKPSSDQLEGPNRTSQYTTTTSAFNVDYVGAQMMMPPPPPKTRFASELTMASGDYELYESETDSGEWSDIDLYYARMPTHSGPGGLAPPGFNSKDQSKLRRSRRRAVKESVAF